MRISTISNETSDALNAGLSSTTQFTVTVDTMLFTGLDGVLVTDTEDGGGTEEKKVHYFMALFFHTILTC